MQLLTYPSLVESPFIIVTIGNYTFGKYTKTSSGENYNVSFPNYIKSVSAKKINGALNTYTIVIEYPIEAGSDPNLMDKIFSSSNRQIEISYGDYATPTMIYSKERALISKINDNIDFGNSRITYTLSCVSTSLKSRSIYIDMPYTKDKPSNVIRNMLKDSRYGLWDIFPGMKNISDSVFNSLIPSIDSTVEIDKKSQVNALDYLNYLVSCMTTTEDLNSNMKRTRFYLSLQDDTSEEFDGAYFKIVHTTLGDNIRLQDNSKIYEVDVGYPTDDLVTSFVINSNSTYSILYDTALVAQTSEYSYRIDDNGNIVEKQDNMITNDRSLFKTTEASKTWWSNMTSYPITATMTVKGLLRPLLLTSYIFINVYFYGRKHISTGLYIVTAQTDSIDASGYKSTINLTRIGGDEE